MLTSWAVAASSRPLQPEPQPNAIGALMRHARRTRDAEERFEQARVTYERALLLVGRNSSRSLPASEEERCESGLVSLLGRCACTSTAASLLCASCMLSRSPLSSISDRNGGRHRRHLQGVLGTGSPCPSTRPVG